MTSFQPWSADIIDITAASVFSLGNRTVNRMGYGAMQLAGPGVFGPTKDRHAALAVLREVVARGVNHIDTSDFYGPRHAVVSRPRTDKVQFAARINANADDGGRSAPQKRDSDGDQCMADQCGGIGSAVVIHPAIDSSCVKVARFLVYEIPISQPSVPSRFFMASTPTLVRRQNSQVACRTTVLHMDSVQSFLNRFAFLATIFVLALLIAYMTQ